MGAILSCAPSLQSPKRLGVQPTCPGGNGTRPSPYIFLPGNKIGSKESHPKCGNQTKCGRERSSSDAQETRSFHYCYRSTWGRSHLCFDPSLPMRNRTRRSPVSQLVAVARRRFLGTTPNIPVTLFSYPRYSRTRARHAVVAIGTVIGERIIGIDVGISGTVNNMCELNRVSDEDRQCRIWVGRNTY